MSKRQPVNQQSAWTMTSHSKLILVVPRPEGVLVSIDGVSHYKDMTAHQLLWMAERFLRAGLEASREEEENQQGCSGNQQGHKENNL